MNRPTKHCHKIIREVAQEATKELYEVVMGDNLVRKRWRKQNEGASEKELLRRFVARNWSRCIPFARATLATRLRDPHIDKSLAESIMDVLVKDASLVRGRSAGRTIIMPSGAKQ